VSGGWACRSKVNGRSAHEQRVKRMPKTITIFGPDLRRFTLTMRDDQAGQNGPNVVTIVDLVEQLVRAFYNSKSYRAEAVTATLCLDGNPAFRLPRY
jgi:hypothetical protein